MATYDRVEGSCYTAKILCPELSDLFAREQNKFKPYLRKISDPSGAHIGIKYLGYDKDYDEKTVRAHIPNLKRIAEKYLPLEIKVKGIGLFPDKPGWPSNELVIIELERTTELLSLHNEVVNYMSGKMDSFNLAEREFYTPHITLGVGKPGTKNQLLEVAATQEYSGAKSITVHGFGLRLLSKNPHRLI